MLCLAKLDVGTELSCNARHGCNAIECSVYGGAVQCSVASAVHCLLLHYTMTDKLHWAADSAKNIPVCTA